VKNTILTTKSKQGDIVAEKTKETYLTSEDAWWIQLTKLCKPFKK
jgi:hypothetical protein